MSGGLSPIRDDRSAPFFDGAQRNELMVRHCPACGHLGPPAALLCTACRHAELDWVGVSGEATVVTWIVVHGKPGRDGVVPDPLVIVTGELAEGPWLNALFRGDVNALGAGAAVRVAFEAGDRESIPVFVPVSS
jgi:uncharacterized protein